MKVVPESVRRIAFPVFNFSPMPKGPRHHKILFEQIILLFEPMTWFDNLHFCFRNIDDIDT